jgi:hypothetical protein
MSMLEMFIPITKVDAAQRLVYGIATAEIEDRSGEICDYESTKPYYEKWSDEIAKSTGGRSLGNVRAMHGAVAAGKVTALTFNDARRQIEVCAKIVDDAEWAKIREGVYTGFSQGGSYVRRWRDADGLQRYTAQPLEISLVDLPCLPQARFEMIKADGSREWRGFRKDFDLVARLSAIIDMLDDLQTDAVLDSIKDADGSDFSMQLKTLLGRAVGILRELVDDETSSFASDDDTPMKAARVASRHARVPALSTSFSKIGARNSADDLSRIQNMHDTSVELGAACEAQKHASGGLEKRFDAIAAKLDDLLTRVKNIESQPMPLPLAGRVRSVSKIEDGALESEKDDEPAPVDRDALALLAIKKAQRNGRSYLNR